MKIGWVHQVLQRDGLKSLYLERHLGEDPRLMVEQHMDLGLLLEGNMFLFRRLWTLLLDTIYFLG